MEAVDYRITEGTEYMWECWGSDTFVLDSYDSNVNGYNISIIFDTRTQIVYQAAAYDYKRNRAYRLMNPLYEEDYRKEALSRKVNANEALEDLNFIDLEEDDDFLRKATAIAKGLDYDARISITLDLSDNTIFQLMKMAHDQDVTLNHLVEEVLRAEMDKLEE